MVYRICFLVFVIIRQRRNKMLPMTDMCNWTGSLHRLYQCTHLVLCKNTSKPLNTQTFAAYFFISYSYPHIFCFLSAMLPSNQFFRHSPHTLQQLTRKTGTYIRHLQQKYKEYRFKASHSFHLHTPPTHAYRAKHLCTFTSDAINFA